MQTDTAIVGHEKAQAVPRARRLPTFIRARLTWILIVGTLGAASAGSAAYLVSNSLPKVYESEAMVLIGSLTETSNDNLIAYQALAQTYAELGTTSPILSKVIEQLGLHDSIIELSRRVAVRAQAGTVFVRVATRASTPDAAARLADALGAAVVNLATPLDTGPSLATIVQPGLAPEFPSEPRILLNTAVGMLIGAITGGGLVYLLARAVSALPVRAADAADRDRP